MSKAKKEQKRALPVPKELENIQPLKPLPAFKNEDEEREFWATHDTTDYFDFSNARPVNLPNLKFSTRTISIRFPQSLIDAIKVEANRRDVPYQSLIKMILHEWIEEKRGKKLLKEPG